MTETILSSLAGTVAARIKLALPDLATCKAISGRLDLEEVQRQGFKPPAVLVSRLRLEQGPGLAGPYHRFRVVMAAFILTADRVGLPRDTAAANIAQVLLQLLPDQTFDQPHLGGAEKVAEEPLASVAIKKAGVAISVVTWEAEIALTPLPDVPDVSIEIYVGGELIGGGE